MKKKLNTFVIIFALVLLSSCSSAKKYHADWVIVKVTYQKEDVTEHLDFGNLTINLSNGNEGFVPGLWLGEFKEESLRYDDSFDLAREDNKDFIIIRGSKFFDDKFEIKCLDENCCTISLSNETKYVELIYNSGSKRKHKKCPMAKDRLKNYDRYRNSYPKPK